MLKYRRSFECFNERKRPAAAASGRPTVARLAILHIRRGQRDAGRDGGAHRPDEVAHEGDQRVRFGKLELEIAAGRERQHVVARTPPHAPKHSQQHVIATLPPINRGMGGLRFVRACRYQI